MYYNISCSCSLGMMGNKIMKKTLSSEPLEKRCRRRQRSEHSVQGTWENDCSTVFVDVGRCLRRLRDGRDLSIRALAEQSGLNVNTLSLIENGKSSPSVSTLQQLASALAVPITAFFEMDIPKNMISYQKSGNGYVQHLRMGHSKIWGLVNPAWWAAIIGYPGTKSQQRSHADCPYRARICLLPGRTFILYD